MVDGVTRHSQALITVYLHELSYTNLSLKMKVTLRVPKVKKNNQCIIAINIKGTVAQSLIKLILDYGGKIKLQSIIGSLQKPQESAAWRAKR